MATLDTILKNTDPNALYAAYDDFLSPEGHFLVTTKILGILRTYLLEGELNDPESVIRGRTDIDKNMRVMAYKGNRLLGGLYLGEVREYKKSYAAMV